MQLRFTYNPSLMSPGGITRTCVFFGESERSTVSSVPLQFGSHETSSNNARVRSRTKASIAAGTLKAPGRLTSDIEEKRAGAVCSQ